MALCLYHPECGYYMQGRERTGIGGDYFTSSDLHPVFARLVARQAAEMWRALGEPSPFTWVEMGAGRGWFARDFLGWTQRALPEFAAALEYVVVEPASKQRATIRRRLAEAGLDCRVRLTANLEELSPVTGCFFSNELVDAFPVAVVTRTKHHLQEVYVNATGDSLGEELGPISDPAISAYIARYAPRLAPRSRCEVNRQAIQWMRSLSEKLVRGFVITIDYGDLSKRLYTSDRPRGTLLAYRGHTPTEDSYAAPGECDLTAHVNFSALIETGKDAGLDLTGFVTQEGFLLALGEANQFAELYDPEQTELEKLQARLKLKRLISPAGMGNIFKVLIQHRDLPAPRLTGLRYARL
jgi:SAM-dependent MidA family methyltransferase